MLEDTYTPLLKCVVKAALLYTTSNVQKALLQSSELCTDD